MNRHDVQARMASMSEGPIYEIGGGRGHGSQAMRGATDLPITVVDPYIEYKDLLGGEYGPETLAEFLANTDGLDVELVREDARTAELPERIGLLWVDLTMAYEPLYEVVARWAPLADIVGVTGLEYDNLGTKPLMKDLMALGFERILEDQALVAAFKRTVKKRAAFWICSADDGGRYVREAALSARSVEEQLGIDRHLFLFGQTEEDTAAFTVVHAGLWRESRFWYLDSTRAFCSAARELREYDQLLYLDTDTHVCCPCHDLFHLLDQYDMALGQSPQRDAIPSAVGAPPAFTTLSIGVNTFRNTKEVRCFLSGWHSRYVRDQDLYDNNDQAPLRDCLYLDGEIRWVTLPPEYALRFDFGAWAVGKVRILHGRVDGISTDKRPLDEVCERINASRKMRLWSHGRFVS